ncbi:MAG: hypothetical protein HC890_10850 [Chloroflexaceae bacterium]|nr:hypothetical protein [Chloroflexaceae bacterium]
MLGRFHRLLAVGLICVLLGACSAARPPLELAPPGDIVQKAILLQLELAQQRLAEQLDTPQPRPKIGSISVKQLDPLYTDSLATYHLQGTYNLRLQLPHQEISQSNPFDIFLQRQIEGKSWRLLREENQGENQQSQWFSYLVP